MTETIAFVCQRYGEKINGGAETECRMYAERLTPFYHVEVLTTCAMEYTTWENYYSAGEERLNGVTVRRFPVLHGREKERFEALSSLVKQKEHEESTEEEWMEAQGPCCPALTEYLRKFGRQYKCVFFMTYLYYTTARGLPATDSCRILIPTAHDEWPIYLRCFRRVFREADRILYNTLSEKAFTEKLFPAAASKPNAVAGAGVDLPHGEILSARERFGLPEPYICYCGRVDASKGCDLLFRYFTEYKERKGGSLQLVLTGKTAMEIPEREDIRSLGFVSEEEKFAVMKDSAALVLASQFESLSIVVLESMAMGRPVLVNGRCEVLKEHCVQSNAGLYFDGYYEFEAALDHFLADPEECAAMGRNGKEYVKRQYRWDGIIARIRELIE